MSSQPSRFIRKAVVGTSLRRRPIPRTFRFDDRYQELVVLRDGTRVTLRLLRSEDREMLRRGFERLSPEARYNRFFADKQALLEDELAYLTEIDQLAHFGIVAGADPPDAEDAGLGVVRGVQLKGDPGVYEGAVTVADAVQGRGLGRILAERLLAGLRERGAERVRFNVLAANLRMITLVRELGGEPARPSDDGVVEIDVPLEADIR
jgi:GNAT superfamily N-acetyltransferase